MLMKFTFLSLGVYMEKNRPDVGTARWRRVWERV